MKTRFRHRSTKSHNDMLGVMTRSKDVTAKIYIPLPDLCKERQASTESSSSKENNNNNSSKRDIFGLKSATPLFSRTSSFKNTNSSPARRRRASSDNDGNLTVCSVDTVKVSNVKAPIVPSTSSSPGRLSPLPCDDESNPKSPMIRRLKTMVKRFQPATKTNADTTETAAATTSNSIPFSNVQLNGRDGIDSLSLGPHPSQNSSLMVLSRLNTPSSSENVPAMVLEGYSRNACDDRWTVRVDKNRGEGSDVGNDDAIARVIAWEGGASRPPDGLASCPVDIDEDLFIIEAPAHLYAVHHMAEPLLQQGQFDEALKIFQKIYKSQKQKHGGDTHYHVGSALHNIGVVQLWAGRFKEALQSFRSASRVRFQTLKSDHPDVAVSLIKLGTAFFALNQYSEAIESFNRALKIANAIISFYTNNASHTANSNNNHCQHQQALLTKAKVLNNIGCVHFQKRQYSVSMSTFLAALEIQRQWLGDCADAREGDGVVSNTPSSTRGRREFSTVFDASICLNNLGRVYIEMKDWDMAIVVCEEAHELQRNVFQRRHPIVVMSTCNIKYAKSNLPGATIAAF